MRSKSTYRAVRRNEARDMLRKVRSYGQKATFAEVWADAQANWGRHEPLPKVKHRPVRSPRGWLYRFSDDRQRARYARQIAAGQLNMEGVSNG